MSGNFWLDWAVMAVSLFNTILALWLGLTVILNAERRTAGIWLAGGGLLMGGVFFLSHTAILGFGGNPFSQGANWWWRFGWIPVILAPYAWYMVMLWYAGFWEDPSAALYRRQVIWFWLLSLTGGSMLLLLAIANPLPSFLQAAQFNFNAVPAINGMPAFILLYPAYILACIGFSLDALLRPGPTLRMMGKLARQRARPWLAAASIALLFVSVLVGSAILWIALNVHNRTIYQHLEQSVTFIDLLIASLIGFAIGFTGQAIASYEVFTGKSLPRRGLLRYWHRALILAAGYSVVISLSLRLYLYPFYTLLLSTCLLVVFYALLSWRSYADQERLISNLRPFVASQQLYDQLLSPAADASEMDLNHPFRALCEAVLGTRLAYLIPIGPMAPLFGPALTYPYHATAPAATLAEITKDIISPKTLCIPIEAEGHGGAVWAVPLWNERGMSGFLLLGEKAENGLYSQEEIEIARAAGERIMDIQASTELSRRLMELQRRRMAESQLTDQRTRRILHDDVLPKLHAAMLNVNTNTAANLAGEELETVSLLSEAHRQVADLLRDLPAPLTPEVARLGLLGALQSLVQNELKNAFDQVDWRIHPKAAESLPRIPLLSAEVVYYATREAMRNAARHARGDRKPSTLHLRIEINWGDGVEVIVEDNGIGIAEASRGEGGSGRGLALHSTLLAVVGGSLSIESTPGSSTRVRIKLPVDPNSQPDYPDK